MITKMSLKNYSECIIVILIMRGLQTIELRWIVLLDKERKLYKCFVAQRSVTPGKAYCFYCSYDYLFKLGEIVCRDPDIELPIRKGNI